MKQIPYPLELLMLRIISDRVSMSDYRLERFFAKSAAFDFYPCTRRLVENGLITVDDPEAQVKLYTVSAKGCDVLHKFYNTDSLKDYVMGIEPTGFIFNILQMIDEREAENNRKSI